MMIAKRTTIAFSLALIMLSLASAQDVGKKEADQKLARTKILLVVGAAGTDEYAESFSQWAAKWDQVGKASGSDVVAIGRDEVQKQSDRERLETAITALDKNAITPVWLVLIGHGTFAGNVAKFNLRGLDVSATELSGWLQPIQRPIVVVNCASSSGPFVNRLSGPQRVIVTATKSGTEQNFARFGQYFANAIGALDSDLDHDDEVSVQEAFLRASADVKVFYDSDARIITEHALLDDNGDGKGTPASMFRGTRAIAKAKKGAKLDGAIAARITLTPEGSRLPFTEEEIEQRRTVEVELDELRKRKSELSEADYEAKLEPLMIRLAKIYRIVEARADAEEQ
ncbi:MAG: hypothetical protein AB8B91_02405 [Rubripirellula sp.]